MGISCTQSQALAVVYAEHHTRQERHEGIVTPFTPSLGKSLVGGYITTRDKPLHTLRRYSSVLCIPTRHIYLRVFRLLCQHCPLSLIGENLLYICPDSFHISSTPCPAPSIACFKSSRFLPWKSSPERRNEVHAQPPRHGLRRNNSACCTRYPCVKFHRHTRRDFYHPSDYFDAGYFYSCYVCSYLFSSCLFSSRLLSCLLSSYYISFCYVYSYSRKLRSVICRHITPFKEKCLSLCSPNIPHPPNPNPDLLQAKRGRVCSVCTCTDASVYCIENYGNYGKYGKYGTYGLYKRSEGGVGRKE